MRDRQTSSLPQAYASLRAQYRGWVRRLTPAIISREKLILGGDMLTDLIKKYLVESAGVDPEKFKDPNLMVADLGLDSLGLVEMLFEVEDKFGFQIPDPMVFLPMSFTGMVTAIDEMVRARSDLNLQKTDATS